MTASLAVPTATSVRAIPAKLLVDNRIVINNHLRRGRGGKVSFTHLIGYAVVKALVALPEMNLAYAEENGKPAIARPDHVNLGLAIDVRTGDGSRQLLVPNLKAAEEMDFRQFWTTYEDVVRRARAGKLAVADFQGTTATITNPGTIGTEHSVPRLMAGQGCIVGVGAMEYPAAYAGASEETLARLAISKSVTLTSTYDHRIIQGAQSGEFLKKIHELLLGEDGFYDEIFAALRIPYEPVRWVRDFPAGHEDDVARSARVQELIHAYRVRGHLMADTNPLEVTQRKHPDLDINLHGLTLWDLERDFPTGGFGGKARMKLRDILGVLRDSYCRTVGHRVHAHPGPGGARAGCRTGSRSRTRGPSTTSRWPILSRLNVAEAFEMFLQTKFVGQRRFSLEGAESLIPLLDAVLTEAAEAHLDEAVIGMAHRGRLNVLANIVGKSYAQIFKEFEGNLDPSSAQGSGDVKYHLGAEGTFRAPDGRVIRTSLVANPSHLEAVDPVLEGVVRARQDVIDKGEPGFTVLPVLIHGDAAFAGQGVVAETLNLSLLRGYRTGGTVHIIVNNQVGFTTAPQYSRSSVYATDVARMIQAPIFHVNGDDPEAVVRIGQAGLRLPAGVQEGRRHGHDLLPQAGAQRDRQPVVHPAAHVRPGGGQAVDQQGVHGVADRPRRHHHGGGRGGAARLPAAARAGLHRDQGRGGPAGRARQRAQARARGPPGRPRGGTDRGDRRDREADHRHSGQPARGLHPAPAAQAAARPARGHARARTRSTGRPASCWRSARWSWTGTRCGWSARTAGAARSASGTRCWWTGTPAPSTRRSSSSTSGAAKFFVLRLAAVRVRRDGLRVRLLGGPPGRPGLLGGPVRGLHRRRADDHRRVHQLR